MSPEDFFCHGTLKVEMIRVLSQRVKQDTLGHLVTDRTRISCPAADLSAEPDIVFASNRTLESERVQLIPKTTGQRGRYVELEGPPDLVVEIVSDRSVTTDTRRLPEAYFAAGVREFWLADARGETLVFQICQPGASAYEAVEPDTEGFQHSAVFGCKFHLDRSSDAHGHWTFDLREKEAG
jgi:Uma2 family endonuclease